MQKQIGSYGEALADHERNANHEEGRNKIERWRAELTMVAGVTVWWLKYPLKVIISIVILSLKVNQCLIIFYLNIKLVVFYKIDYIFISPLPSD